jgi:nicotinamide-nucleotide amidase
MRAAILAVGSELLGTDRLDTNSLALTAALERHGVELGWKGVVGDEEGEIASEVARLVERCGLVLVSGGLGPTADDVTRPAVARALGRGIAIDPALVAWLEERFRGFGIRMPEVNRRQAEVIDGAEVIPNPRGSAPGMRIDAGAATLFLFPGVPSELRGMVASHLEPWLAARAGGRRRESGVLKVAALAESTVEERIAPAYGEFGREAITVLSSPGEVRLQFWAAGPDGERRGRLAAMGTRLRELIGPAVFADDAEATLERVVGELLRARGATLATAESCTGGLVAERLTRVPGSSDYFLGGAVAYSNEMKTRLLGVPEALLAAHGAVSEPVARAMAAGARAAFGADFAVAVTGVAGPGGGSDEKPVGTVHLALAGPASAAAAGAGGGAGDGGVEHRRARFPGDREGIRERAAQLALEMVRRRLLGAAAAPAAQRPARGAERAPERRTASAATPAAIGAPAPPRGVER